MFAIEHTEGQRRVLKAARALVRKKSYAQVSLRDIASASGYSPAGLYAHFRGRDAILDALAGEVRAELGAALEAALREGAAPEESLVDVGCAYVGFAMARPAEFELLFRWTRSKKQHRADPSASPFDLLRRLARGARPDLDEEAIDTACLGLWSAAHGLAALRTSHLAGFPGDWALWCRRILEDHVRGALRADAPGGMA